MKQFGTILAITLIACLTSCQSTQQKAEALAEKATKHLLFIPDSYEAVSTQVDTAFYNPCFEPEVITEVKKILDAEDAINDAKLSMSSASSSMAIWGKHYGYYSDFERHEYNEAKKKYDEAVSTVTKAQNTIDATTAIIKDHLSNAPWNTVIGWQIEHRFRAKTAAGVPSMGDYLFIANTDLSEILFYADGDDEEYMRAIKKLEEIAIAYSEEVKAEM